MAKTKNVTAHFFHLVKNYAGNTENLSEQEMTTLINTFKAIPISPEDGGLSRYGRDSDKMIIFREDGVVPLPENDSYECCLFLKRRTSAYPYQRTEYGDLLELTLSENAELVEVSYLLIDKKKGLILLAFNRNVGGYRSLSEYINNVVENCSQQRFKIGNNSAILDLSYILNENPENDFRELEEIKSMSLRLSGNFQTLEQLLSAGGTSTRTALKEMVHLGNNANCGVLKFDFIKSRQSNAWLDKGIISRIYQSLKPHFQADNHQQRFSVIGTIDEETRVIDLINDKYCYHSQFEYIDRYIPPSRVLNILIEAFNGYRTTLIRVLSL